MIEATLPGVELDTAESRRIRRALARRMSRLDRCRVVLDVERFPTSRAGDGLNSSIPERFRIVYQRASMRVWQATALGPDGALLAEVVSDGTWIEAGGKLWDIRHSDWKDHERRLEAREEYQLLTVEERSRCERERDDRSDELGKLLWPHGAAVEHLQLDLSFITEPLMPRDWLFYRDADKGNIYCRTAYGTEHRNFPPSRWALFRWRIARLFRPGLPIDSVYGIREVRVTEHEYVLSELSGYMPETANILSMPEMPDFPDAQDLVGTAATWDEPIPIAPDLFVPRTSHEYRAGELLREVTLKREECVFGANIPLDIRPVEESLERVDW